MLQVQIPQNGINAGLKNKVTLRTLFQASNEVALGSGTSTTRDGIEMCEGFDCLKQEGCTEGQVHLFGKFICLSGLSVWQDSAC
jgi:hypothetical protein